MDVSNVFVERMGIQHTAVNRTSLSSLSYILVEAEREGEGEREWKCE